MCEIAKTNQTNLTQAEKALPRAVSHTNAQRVVPCLGLSIKEATHPALFGVRWGCGTTQLEQATAGKSTQTEEAQMGNTARDRAEFRQAWQEEFNQMRKLAYSLSPKKAIAYCQKLDELQNYLDVAIEETYPAYPTKLEGRMIHCGETEAL